MPRSAIPQVATGFFFADMIPLNEGYRGSLIWSVTLTRAGSEDVMVWVEASPSRRIVTTEPSTESSDA